MTCKQLLHPEAAPMTSSTEKGSPAVGQGPLRQLCSLMSDYLSKTEDTERECV